MSPELEAAIQAVKEAGALVMGKYRGNYETVLKTDESPVTEADLASQECLEKRLENFGYGFVGEESKDLEFPTGRVWVVDPLDGTKDFIQKTDEFAVMIGLAEAGEVIAGVVHLPAQDLTYWAERGRGAYKQEKDSEPRRIEVSTVSTLPEARVATSRFHLDEDTKRFLEQAGITQTATVGSLGFKIASVAEGVIDLYLTTTDKTCLWDICAGDIILQEAGGEMVDLRGQPFVYDGRQLRNEHGILVTNGRLTSSARAVVEQLKEANER